MIEKRAAVPVFLFRPALIGALNENRNSTDVIGWANEHLKFEVWSLYAHELSWMRSGLKKREPERQRWVDAICIGWWSTDMSKSYLLKREAFLGVKFASWLVRVALALERVNKIQLSIPHCIHCLLCTSLLFAIHLIFPACLSILYQFSINFRSS